MQNKDNLKRNIDDLKNRALKRRLSFPAQKDAKDASVENTFFTEAKEHIYKQIAR